MDKIKVTHYIHDLGLSGTAKRMQLFLKYADKSIFSFNIITEEKGERTETMRRYVKGIHTMKNNDEFVKALELEKPDILHLHGCSEHLKRFVGLASKQGIRTIIDHTNFGNVTKEFFDSELEGKVTRRLVPSMFCAMRFLYMNNMDLDQFLEKHRVVYDPLELHRDGHKIKGSGGYTIGRMARNNVHKWDKHIIDVFSEVKKKVPNAKMLLVGFPDAWRKDLKKTEIGKDVTIIDNVPVGKEFELFYSKIDVLAGYVNTIMGESFGNTNAEGMLLKKPIVVNSTPLFDNAQIELVENGKTGFCVSSPESFADALIVLLKNKELAKKMGEEGFKEAKRKYEAPIVTKNIEKLYIDALLENGFALDDALIDKYKKIEYSPSKKELAEFVRTYDSRLLNCFNKISALYRSEALFYKAYYRFRLMELHPKIVKNDILRRLVKSVLTNI